MKQCNLSRKLNNSKSIKQIQRRRTIMSTSSYIKYRNQKTKPVVKRKRKRKKKGKNYYFNQGTEKSYYPL